MALELFKPFIYNRLEQKGLVTTIKAAKKMVERETPEVWDTLDEVVREYPIMLNRAPTLHRLGIQAFEPVLIEGKAIQLHPLVCSAYNADFDGDQMAVHIPLSIEAQIEARVLMMSTNNILSPANGEPNIVPSQDIVLGIYYLSREKPFAKGENKIYSSLDEVRIAYDMDEVDLHARIFVRINGKLVNTTVGRVILFEIIPAGIPFDAVNKLMTKKELRNLVGMCYRTKGVKSTVILADRLKDFGYKYATKAGISISIKDMIIPSNKANIIDLASEEVKEIEQQYIDGVITDGEKYNKVVDVWAKATEDVAGAMMKEISTEAARNKEGEMENFASFNPIYMMADSGSRGSKDQMRQLSGMRGLMAKPSGEIIETPITANFREGLTVLQYFVSTHGARKGLADTALKTANSGYLTRRLVDVAQDTIISEVDCGTIDGIYVEALREAGEVIEDLSERIVGRYAAENLRSPFNNDIIVEANQEITEDVMSKIEEAGIERVRIRSVLTCESRHGICAKCYGRDLAHGNLVEIGESVGIIAAQSIGEPGTQLTMRTFHIGGTARRHVEQSSISTKSGGVVKFINLNAVRNKAGRLVVMNRNGELAMLSEQGHEREKHPLVYGAVLTAEEGQKVEPGTLLAGWDPFTTPIITEVTGTVKFGDVVSGRTMKEKLDPITGKASKVIVEYKDTDVRPRISVKDDTGKTTKLTSGIGVARYLLPVGAIITVNEGDTVMAGEPIAKIPRETTKTKDITGGLPRVAELFEVRKPKENAIITEIDGEVAYGKHTKGKRKVIVTPEFGDPKEYLIPKGKHISVHEGDYVKAGDALMDGSANPHDILNILGVKELAKYLVNEVQEVYRLQGVRINNKHIEVIVRQMLRRVTVKEVGDTSFLPGEQVEKWRFQEENDGVVQQGGSPAIGEPLLLGITKASLSTESFISAASFQETTRVLTDASIAGRIDQLRGLKENVIMGRLIPAGTGMDRYRTIYG